MLPKGSSELLRIKGEVMTKVFTDQLAALPLSEVYIYLSASGGYTAAIALEGRQLNIYENEGLPLERLSLNAIKQYLLACGCPSRSFVIDLGVDVPTQARTAPFVPSMATAAM